MPSSDTSVPGSLPGQYLLGLLADGAQPFAYRSGVHRLLGLPDQAVRPMRPRLSLLPVGFQYEQRGFAAPLPAPLLQQPLQPPRSVRATPEALEEATIQEHDAPVALRPEPRPASALGKASSGKALSGKASSGKAPPMPSLSRPGAADVRNEPALPEPASPPDAVQVEASSRPGRGTPSAQRPEATRQAGLEIPGITQRRMLFRALSGGNDAAQALAGVPLSPPKPEVAALRQGAEARPSVVQPSVVQPSVVQPSVVQPSAVQPSVVQPSAVQPSAVQPSAVQPAAAWSSAVWPSARQRSSASSADDVSSLPAQPSSSKAQALQLRSRNRVTEEVEHLRQVVTTLAARQASAREEQRQEPLHQAASAPPAVSPHPGPPQQVVVVRQTPGSARRTPRAFWASSTLRSTHLRMLR